MSIQSKQIDIDRFSGEAIEPPVCVYCSYCGEPICEGYQYIFDEGMNVCIGCAKPYAYAKLEREAVFKTAKREVYSND